MWPLLSVFLNNIPLYSPEIWKIYSLLELGGNRAVKRSHSKAQLQKPISLGSPSPRCLRPGNFELRLRRPSGLGGRRAPGDERQVCEEAAARSRDTSQAAGGGRLGPGGRALRAGCAHTRAHTRAHTQARAATHARPAGCWPPQATGEQEVGRLKEGQGLQGCRRRETRPLLTS